MKFNTRAFSKGNETITIISNGNETIIIIGNRIAIFNQ